MSGEICHFNGSPDLYGFGIRLGIYLQWTAAWIANSWELESAFSMLWTNGIFLVSTFAAVLRVTTTHTINAAEMIPLINILFSYFVTVFPIFGLRLTFQTRKPLIPVTSIMSILLRAMLLSASCAYLCWYWFHGINSRHVSACPIFVFLFFKANALGSVKAAFQTFAVFLSVGTAFQFLNILFFLLRTLKVSFLRVKPETFNQRQSSFNFTVKSWIYFNFYPISENELMSYWFAEGVNPILRLVNQQHIRAVSQIFYAASICFSILAVELGITWNSLTGVGPHDILSTSQLIPFLVGLLSLFQVVSDLSLKKYNVLDQEEMMTQAAEAERSGYLPYEPEDDAQLNQLVQHYSQNVVVSEESNASGKEQAKQHNQLALAIGSRYERHGYIADFDEAITHSAKAISLDEGYINYHSNMGVHLRVRWQKTHDLQDLDKAIAHLEFMKKRQDLTRANLVNILGDLVRLKKARRTATNEGPDSLIEHMEELYSLMWHEYSRKAPDCLILSELYWEKYEKGGGEVVVLRKAIFYAKQSVKATGDSFLDKAMRLNSWTQKLLDSYRSTKKGILLKRAIEYEKRAESSLTYGQSQGADAYHWLGKLLAELYEKERDAHRIKEAIKYGEFAVDSLETGDSRHGRYFADVERWKARRECT